MPKAGAKEIFAYAEPSFHGDGIFLYSPKPTEEQIRYVEQLLEQIDVKEDAIPDWEKCKLFYLKQEDHSELFLLYWGETETVYIVESFL